MTGEKKFWLEKMPGKTGWQYLCVFLIITGVTLFTYFLFSYHVRHFPWDFYFQLETTALCILLGLELSGIPYIISLVKKTLKEIPLVSPEKSDKNQIFTSFENRFYQRKFFSLLIFLVIIPFVIIQVYEVLTGCPFFYCVEPTGWTILLDIYNTIIGYLVVYLLAILLWICINLIFILNEISDVFLKLIKIDMLKIDKIGGLNPLRDAIVKVDGIYFICITLALLTYVSPFNFINYESLFLMFLFGTGILLFIIALLSIKKLNRSGIEEKILLLNEKIIEHEQKLLNFISESDDQKIKDNLLYTKNKLDILYEERERFLLLFQEIKGYDRKTIILFLSTFIPALLAFLEKTLDVWQKIAPLFGLK